MRGAITNSQVLMPKSNIQYLVAGLRGESTNSKSVHYLCGGRFLRHLKHSWQDCAFHWHPGYGQKTLILDHISEMACWNILIWPLLDLSNSKYRSVRGWFLLQEVVAMLQRELMRSVRPSTFTFCEVIPFSSGWDLSCGTFAFFVGISFQIGEMF